MRPDGTVECWGANWAGQSTPPGGTFTQVSGGAQHTCGIRTDGTVECWGANWAGQASPPGGTFTQVSAGAPQTCGIRRTDGSVECWGGFLVVGCRCDDGNACTEDSWGGTQCVYAPLPDGTACDDGNTCTVNDQCQSGTCQPGGFAPAGTSCDDGLYCNGTDTCDGSGTCLHSGDPCVGGAQCNQSCNEAQDNCFDPPGTPCDDGLVCTADSCDGAGSCLGTPLPSAQCPKGYVLLEAPSSAVATVEVRRNGQALGAVCGESVRLSRLAQVGGDAVVQTSDSYGLSLGVQARVGGACVTGGGTISLAASAQCVGGQGSPGAFGQVLSDCIGAADLADVRRGALMALPADQTFGAVTVASDTTVDVSGFGGVPVIDYQSLVVKPTRR